MSITTNDLIDKLVEVVMHSGAWLMIEACSVFLSQQNSIAEDSVYSFASYLSWQDRLGNVRRENSTCLTIILHIPSVILRTIIEMPISESLDHRARDDTMSVLPSLEKTYMAIAKNRVSKKSLRKLLEAGAVNRSKRDLDLARKEEEAIAQMVKDFRKQEGKKKKRVKPTVISVSSPTDSGET